MCNECGATLFAISHGYKYGRSQQKSDVRHFVKPDGTSLCGRCRVSPKGVTVVLPLDCRLCTWCLDAALAQAWREHAAVVREA